MRDRTSELSNYSRAMGHAESEKEYGLRVLADTLAARGLRVPALVALTAGRPLTLLLGQLLWIAQPAASLFWHNTRIEALAHLLEDEHAVSQLQSYLSADKKDE